MTSDLSAEPDFSSLVEVRLLALPVPLWAKSSEHSDELFREFALIASDSAVTVPKRLLDLIDTLNKTYGATSADQRVQMDEAAASGQESLDLTYQVPAAVGDACVALNDLLDEADTFCREGQHLLTLTTPPELVRFRRWYLGEFVSQVAGADPVPWPEYTGG